MGHVIGGRFRVLSLIGEGGMGRVYLAEQPMGRTFRKVAIKTLQSQYARDAQVIARFQRECGLVCQLEHPNTIQFFDFGQTANDDLYIVMEYVQGNTLADVLEKQGAMSQERVAVIFQQICGALEEAHKRGIVHRDLKPQNVMLTTRAGQADFVKLLDFGIAKGQTSNGADASKLTQQGMMLGTPPYMSPEQFRGQAVDTRSDIYSLGVIAYEMLTGRLPFQATTSWEWATQHLIAQPMTFEEHEELGAQVSPSMKAAIMRALAKNPAERQGSARELLEELRAGSVSLSITPMPVAAQMKTEVMMGVPEEVWQTEFAATAFTAFTKKEGESERGSYGEVEGPLIPPGPRFAKLRRTSPDRSIMFALPRGARAIARLPRRYSLVAIGVISALAAASQYIGGAPDDMAAIPGGSFDSGIPGVPATTVRAFYLDLTEVTAESYAACVRRGQCSDYGLDCGPAATYGAKDKGSHPINCADWSQAATYCNAVGKRLPTKEELIWATQGGKRGWSYPWGHDEPDFQLCWSGISKRAGTCAVGSFPQGKNPWEVQDLLGNVGEWTASEERRTTPSGMPIESANVVQVGSWDSNQASDLRVYSWNLHAVVRYSKRESLGFRCAK